MNMFYKIIIIAVCFLMELTTVCSKEIKDRHRIAQEYMVQINDDWIDLVSNVYLFQESYPAKKTKESSNDLYRNFKDFKEFFAEKILHIEKREYATVRYFPCQNESVSQPRTGFGQWILQKREVAKSKSCWPYYGMDVQDAWSRGYTGLDIKVAVVDNGVEIDHPDLKRNVDKDLCHSFVDGNKSNVKPLRFPNYWETEYITSHGTMAAGLIAGEFGNDVCSAGIAFNAKLIALKVFKLKEDPSSWLGDGFQFQVNHVPAALAYRMDEIDIYSCSFNLYNKFKAISLDLRTVMKEGVEKGRKGKGSIYVFSAGDNKGSVYDCNMEALASSIYTITISSVGTNGSKPSYAIPCANTLAATFGEFKTLNGSKKLETTTHRGKCNDFIGTSASAALASGIFALALQANPELTWRDLQHITILSSSFKRLQRTGRLETNSAGLQYDPYFGFGLANATAMILLANSWKKVPIQIQRNIDKTRFFEKQLVVTLRFDSCEREENCVRFLEHTMVNLKYRTTNEPSLDIILCSPARTCSYLLNRRRKLGRVRKRFIQRTWNFTSVHFWGENPEGQWVLLFKDTPNHSSNLKTKQQFEFISADLTLFGTTSKPFGMHYNVSVEQQQKHSKTNNFTKWYDDVMNIISSEIPKPDVDDVLDFVEETTKNPTNYWAGIITFIIFTAFLIVFAILRYILPKDSSESSNQETNTRSQETHTRHVNHVNNHLGKPQASNNRAKNRAGSGFPE